jgi:competence protein ComGD
MKLETMKGFTLVESLIVVFACTTFLLLPTLSINRWQQGIELEQFLSTFEKHLLLTQQMAIVTMQDTKIIFDEQEQQLQFVLSDTENIQLPIPTALKASGPDKIVFKSMSGNNGRLAKFAYFWTEKKQLIEFQFQLGSGRYVKKITQL